MPRQTIPMGTFTSVTTAPFALLFSSPQVLLQFPLEEGIFFVGGGGCRTPPTVPPSTHPSSPLRRLFMLPQLPDGAGDSPPLWRAEGAMTDSTDGAWKLPAKTSALWCNKEPEPEIQREIWVEKREMGSAWERGDKEGLWGRVSCLEGRKGGRKIRGRSRWWLFKEGGVPKKCASL